MRKTLENIKYCSFQKGQTAGYLEVLGVDGGHRVAQHLFQDGEVDGVADCDFSLLRFALPEKKTHTYNR